MASQIQPWEREVKDGLATLSSTTAPNTTTTATCSTPPPTVDVSDTTNTQTRQPAWPYNINLGEEVKDLPGITLLFASLSLGLRPSPSLVLTETLTP
jgi:hypothetical protein